MFKLIKRRFPLDKEGELNKLKTENEELKQQVSEQADALIELAEIITEE